MSTIGVPREVKSRESRVALTPAGAEELMHDGHDVLVEAGAGAGSGFPDSAYAEAGCRIVDRGEAWSADLVVKVKEPVPSEFGYLRPGLVLFTYLHLAADRALTEALIRAGTTAIAYETVTHDGRLPLLTPMSEVAGRLAAQNGATLLESVTGGRGVLMGGVSGVPSARVVVIGGGTAGAHAAAVASGMGARVAVFDTSIQRLRDLAPVFGDRVELRMSTRSELRDAVVEADLVIGAVLVPGARAPRLVDAETVARMPAGAVLCDVAIDQGGCFETSRPTTHDDPVYTVDGVLHYCVTNIPGAVPWTSTRALTNATLPYLRRLAGEGVERVVARDEDLAGGVNVYRGSLSHPAVAAAHGMEATPVRSLLAAA